jgi:hypothetical protein
MKKDDLLTKLGPCGILCEKCFAYTGGSIKKNSMGLRNSLGNFDIYAERFSELLNEPKFRKYKEFRILLDYFTEGNCRGCRLDGCMIFPACKVKECSTGKNVNYCYECGSFPCDNTGFDEHLKRRWIDINLRMKEAGVEAYYDEIKDKPRY